MVVEHDEEQHDGYSRECEEKRLMQLLVDLGSRPLVVLRFNPDAYTNDQGVRIESCFKFSPQLRLPSVVNETEYSARVQSVAERIMHWTRLPTWPSKELTIEYFYYDAT